MKLILAFCTFIGFLGTAKSNCTGFGWMKYKDEKCYKVFGEYTNRAEAEQICLMEVGENNGIQSLLSIKSLEEQIFLTDLIFNQIGLVDNVWLGASRFNASVFQWNDGTPLKYSNFQDGSPSNDVNKTCLQMVSHLSKKSSKVEDGKWSDLSCLRKNAVVCQKLQTLSLGEIQKIVLETRKETEEMKNNPVPLGFIYVELPGQPEPQELWPSVSWEEETSRYAGLFFRAEGGNSAPFKEKQNEGAPRLSQVHFADATNELQSGTIEVPANGQFSSAILTGCYTDTCPTNEKVGHSFNVTDDEVRPMNTAVKIWKRTA